MLTFLVSLPELSIEFIDLDTNFDCVCDQVSGRVRLV